jgi:hypothetical protein
MDGLERTQATSAYHVPLRSLRLHVEALPRYKAGHDGLSVSDFAAAWEQGHTLTPEEIVAQAMGVLDPLHSGAG